MLDSIKTVFSRPWYVIAGLSVALALFLFAVWFPNTSLIEYIFSSSNLSFIGKLEFLWNSLGFFTENFTLYSQAIIILVSVLSGINIAMLVFYLRRRAAQDRAAGIGILGTIIGMFGFGCVACNSVILSSILGVTAAAGFIGILPFNGSEIGIIGIIFLVISIVLIYKKISNPAMCKIKNK